MQARIPDNSNTRQLPARSRFASFVRSTWEAPRAGSGRRRRGPLRGIAHLGLRLLSPVYRAGVGVRNWMFDREMRASERLSVPVVSVGNLTVGGTGKTTVVGELVRELLEQGVRVGIVSRGYGRSSEGPVTVSVGNGPELSHRQAGDEPWMLAEISGAAVAVGESKAEAGRRLLTEVDCDMIIVDDGFQHRQLYRDFDIVVLRAEQPLGNGRLLPAGPLREPPASLRRADLVVAVASERSRESSSPTNVRDRVAQQLRAWYDGPVTVGVRKWTALANADGGHDPVEILEGANVVVVCGIGDPGTLHDQVRAAGAKIVASLPFADHHPYAQQDIEQIRDAVRQTGAVWILTTQKDWIKIRPLVQQKVERGFSRWRILEQDLAFPLLDVPDWVQSRVASEGRRG